MQKNIKDQLMTTAADYQARGEQFESFKNELGWEDWMIDLCEDESSLEDGGELTERDVNRINSFLLECWNAA